MLLLRLLSHAKLAKMHEKQAHPEIMPSLEGGSNNGLHVIQLQPKDYAVHDF